MKYAGLLTVLLFAAPLALSAQGPGRAGLSSRQTIVSIDTRSQAAVAHSGMTKSEKGALIGAVVGVVAGVIVSAGYDEKKFSDMAVAGLVMAIPVSLIGSVIGLLMH